MKITVLIGRILFSLLFLMPAFTHMSAQSVGYANSVGLPMASFLVPASGIFSAIGALSILLGYKAKIGGWIIVIFLIPVTFMFHNFWAMTDPMMKQMQMAMFMKNIALLGGAFMITWFGSGPYSIDAKSAK